MYRHYDTVPAMRLVFGGIVIVLVAIVGTWVFLARRQKANTPALDVVASLLTGVQREDGAVRGSIGGYAVTYQNKQYRQAMWTELRVATTGAKVSLELKAANLGDIPAFVSGAPDAAARGIASELRGAIETLHPRSIVIDDAGVTLIADRVIDNVDARPFVQLGVDLASRSAGSAALVVPAGIANEQRREAQPVESIDRTKRVIVALLVLLVVGGGLGVFGYKALQKRKAAAAQSAP